MHRGMPVIAGWEEVAEDDVAAVEEPPPQPFRPLPGEPTGQYFRWLWR